MKVCVTGKHGQLATEFCSIAQSEKDVDLYSFPHNEWDITSLSQTQKILNDHHPDYVLNTAAYTAVDLAEEEQDKAFLVNAKAVEMLANECHRRKIKLVHISTDYVFNGKWYHPYTEKDDTNPINVYGKSKLQGEEIALEKGATVFRVSWLYSTTGKNFVNTMLRLAETKKQISVVSDQIGTPTYAKDAARWILKAIKQKLPSGLYHFSNEGVASWYDFAVAIFQLTKTQVEVIPIESKDFPTKAKRPYYSVLSKQKIKSHIQEKIPHWFEALQECLTEKRSIL